MTDPDKDSVPLWQKILYGITAVIFLLLLIWGADKIGLLGFLAGAGF